MYTTLEYAPCYVAVEKVYDVRRRVQLETLVPGYVIEGVMLSWFEQSFWLVFI